ncbi:MAG: energy-coupling factor ABC transporter ATP-binding protein [Thaumarchaeota archaeon]|nr:energy-coupling factor ABC transporter ATP-binding protein [Nitrososphaerota archaeon]
MIEFDDVSFRHQNGVMALREINLKIATNTLTAIVGENGAGKTTLVRHINGLLKPYQGKVLVFGEDTKKQSVAKLSRKVGIVFQNPDHQLFSDTVENEILFGLRNFGIEEKHDRLEWALEFFDLSRYRNVSPMLLSGGEKKRLCFACVLAWDPDVLILDEPTVGQDYKHKEKIVSMINNLLQKGKTVIIVSHDLEFLWPQQPRTLVMSQGKIIADGNIAEALSDDSVIKQANLVRPQLLALAIALGLKPPSNVKEAAKVLAR